MAQNRNDRTMSKDAWWRVNKFIAQKTESIDAAILLAELIFRRRQYGQGFFRSEVLLAEDLGISVYKVQQARKKLIHHGLIEITSGGVPKKLFYYIKDDAIDEFLDN